MNLRKAFISIITVLSLSTIAVAQETSTTNDCFGNVIFGSTKEEVKSTENSSTLILDQEDELMFNKTSGFIGKSQNCYTFDKEGKLIASSFSFINNHYNLANYIAEYNKVNEALTQKYGEPDQNVVDTEDQELLNDPVKLALAIQEGKVVAVTIWKKDNFTISHILSEKMSTEDMDEETKKVTVITPICHVVLGQLNSAEENQEGSEQ